MNLVTRLRDRARDLLYLPGLVAIRRSHLRGRLLCLRYPRVDEPGRVPFLDRFCGPPIPPRLLLEEMAALYTHEARFFTFSELRRGAFPDPDEFGVLVCFDQGFRSQYTSGLGVLEYLSIRGVLFQTTAMVDASSLLWLHSLYWHAMEPSLAERLRELAHGRFPASRAHSGDDLVRHLRDAEPTTAVQELLAELSEVCDTANAQARIAARLYPDASFLRSARFNHHELASFGDQHVHRGALDARVFETDLVQSLDKIEAIVGRRPNAYALPFDHEENGDREICARHLLQRAISQQGVISRESPPLDLPSSHWPGALRNPLRRQRWLLSGRI